MLIEASAIIETTEMKMTKNTILVLRLVPMAIVVVPACKRFVIHSLKFFLRAFPLYLPVNSCFARNVSDLVFYISRLNCV